MQNDPLYHNFPKQLDANIFENPIKFRPDGRIENLAHGTLNGVDGFIILL